MESLASRFDQQSFDNGYQLVDGVAMHAENSAHFLIPPPVIKRHVRPTHFVELRIDSPRFSIHEDTDVCACPSCNGELNKPILRHEHPSTLVPHPPASVPSRGWGEDFWVRVTRRVERHFEGIVDNRLVESRLHGLRLGSTILFREEHLLAVHGIHREELVLAMGPSDLKELAAWLSKQRRST